MQDYITVSREAEIEYIEKRSRFIAHVFPVQNEEEALLYLDDVRRMHREASHNVYAYSCRKNHISRFSDDGEPGGTAGMPVMNVLSQKGLTDVLVIVTRYFGGTLLGAGGLVRAYSKSAADGISAAGITRMVYSRVLTVSMEYTLLGKIRHLLDEGGYTVLSSDFGAVPTLTICTDMSRADSLTASLLDAAGGKISIAETDTRFCPIPLSEEDHV